MEALNGKRIYENVFWGVLFCHDHFPKFHRFFHLKKITKVILGGKNENKYWKKTFFACLSGLL